ncbi:corticotropin-releasing factor receptor 1 [Aplysia californica]|uniref:Corticotropin-releasing factor receptor 1 n=1 Tax=Aplysia californica TaxID=6500 RepID=A0ABM1A1H1_APLCA|nr:corticotropin-releasing factor receptor 1 [Aplysia californica]
MKNNNASRDLSMDVLPELFDPVKAMEEMRVFCTAYFAENPPYKANVSKACLENGTWGPANYNACMVSEPMNNILDYLDPKDLMGVRIIYNIGYTSTTITLFIALFILLYFRSLRCLRNIIHCHFIVAFIFKNIFWLVLHNGLARVLISGPPKWVCKVFVFGYNYFHTTTFFWMFVEGLYLFTIIVWAFSTQKIRIWHYVIIGWIIPMVCVLAWAVVKANLEDLVCWLPLPYVERVPAYDFVLYAPTIVVLVCNVMFIMVIVYVLVTKLRASNSMEIRQSRKAVRAAVVLLPLLGITFVFFLSPHQEEGVIGIVFKYINAILSSFQGMFVAIFYCFLNGEVRLLLRKKINALQESRTFTRYTKSSLFGSPRRSSCYAMTVTTTNGKAGGVKRASDGSARSKGSRAGEQETEASASMMENML